MSRSEPRLEPFVTEMANEVTEVRCPSRCEALEFGPRVSRLPEGKRPICVDGLTYPKRIFELTLAHL
jgi:hypothetical protein